MECPQQGGTAIGQSEIEEQGVEPGRSDGASESGQPATGESQRVAGAELSADQAAVGTVSRGRSESVAALQLRPGIESGLPAKMRAAVLERVKARYAVMMPARTNKVKVFSIGRPHRKASARCLLDICESYLFAAIRFKSGQLTKAGNYAQNLVSECYADFTTVTGHGSPIEL